MSASLSPMIIRLSPGFASRHAVPPLSSPPSSAMWSVCPRRGPSVRVDGRTLNATFARLLLLLLLQRGDFQSVSRSVLEIIAVFVPRNSVSAIVGGDAAKTRRRGRRGRTADHRQRTAWVWRRILTTIHPGTGGQTPTGRPTDYWLNCMEWWCNQLDGPRDEGGTRARALVLAAVEQTVGCLVPRRRL